MTLLEADYLQAISPYHIWAIEILMIDVSLLLMYSFVRGSTGDSALKGIALVLGGTFVVFYAIAVEFDLFRIKWLLEQVLTYLVFALIVIFQPELRRGVVRLGQNRLFGRLVPGKSDVVKVLGDSVFRLAKSNIGALIALERGVGLNDYADRGTPIDAHLTPELLATIFNPNTPLHDGAVILRGDRVIAAGCLFPLTDNISVSKRLGTRHRAAIGISEESDVISIVVSEETGRVSMAVRGELYQDLDREGFNRAVRSALTDSTTSSKLHLESA